VTVGGTLGCPVYATLFAASSGLRVIVHQMAAPARTTVVPRQETAMPVGTIPSAEPLGEAS
jgi:hypothetical protein